MLYLHISDKVCTLCESRLNNKSKFALSIMQASCWSTQFPETLSGKQNSVGVVFTIIKDTMRQAARENLFICSSHEENQFRIQFTRRSESRSDLFRSTFNYGIFHLSLFPPLVNRSKQFSENYSR